MAKQHRMAVITAAAVIGTGEALIWQSQIALLGGLLLVIAGTVLTALRRSRTLLQHLNRTS